MKPSVVQTWRAVSNAAWISRAWVGSLSNGQGPAYYYVEPNTSSAQRVGTVTIAGQTHTVTQSGSNPFHGTYSGAWSGSCNYSGYSVSVSGNFSMKIDSDGGVTGSYTGSGEGGNISGSVSTTGNFSAQGTATGGVSWSGTFVNQGGAVRGSGTWTLSLCSGNWATN